MSSTTFSKCRTTRESFHCKAGLATKRALLTALTKPYKALSLQLHSQSKQKDRQPVYAHLLTFISVHVCISKIYNQTEHAGSPQNSEQHGASPSIFFFFLLPFTRWDQENRWWRGTKKIEKPQSISHVYNRIALYVAHQRQQGECTCPWVPCLHVRTQNKIGSVKLFFFLSSVKQKQEQSQPSSNRKLEVVPMALERAS